MVKKLSFGKINSHNEWDKLKEIIVGTSIGTMATLTWRNTKPPDKNTLDKAYNLARESCPKWFYDEVEEDLNNLASTLEEFGVIVHRPNRLIFQKCMEHLFGKLLVIIYTIQEI